MKTPDNIPEFIVAYLRGEANEEQSRLSLEWIRNKDNLKLYRQLEDINRLSADIRMLQKFNVQEGKRKVRSRYRANKLQVMSVWMQRVAAVLFIPILLSGIWFYHQQNELRQNLACLIVSQEIVTQPGTKTHLFLPDGTEVWLNASSTIRFPSAFKGDERRIELDGEAYFKVFHNKRMPFIVKTDKLEVEALGTAFNLSAYSKDPKITTTLEEGKVKITDRKNANKIMFLDPGYQLKYNRNNQGYQKQNVRVQDVIAWKDGVLIFDETPFPEVAARLGRWFNADVKIIDRSIVNYRYTGTFTSESLDQVMALLTLSAPIEYSANKRKNPGNTNILKQEIKIWKNPQAKSKRN